MAFGDTTGKPNRGNTKSPTSKWLPQIVSETCRICQSQYRQYVDQMLTAGISLREISEFLTNISGENFDHNVVGRHRKNHLDLRQRAIRKIIERRIQGDIQDVNDVAQSILDRKTMLETAIFDGYDKLMKGEMRINMTDWIAAINSLEAMGKDEKQVELDSLRQEIKVLVNAVSNIMSPAQQRELMRVMNQLPVQAIEAAVIEEEDEPDGRAAEVPTD